MWLPIYIHSVINMLVFRGGEGCSHKMKEDNCIIESATNYQILHSSIHMCNRFFVWFKFPRQFHGFSIYDATSTLIIRNLLNSRCMRIISWIFRSKKLGFEPINYIIFEFFFSCPLQSSYVLYCWAYIMDFFILSKL